MKFCEWCCEKPVDGKAVFCSRKCRQAAFRLRALGWDGAGIPEGVKGGALFGYADPPYINLSRKYYGREKTYEGEVDHVRLIATMRERGYAGWALSCSPKSLRFLLPMMPAGASVCPWVKPGGVPKATRGRHNAWEAVIVVGGRMRRPGARDWLQTHPARLGGSTLIGRKPLAFCAWLFGLLGMVPGDKLDDLFPGTGGVQRAWREINRWSNK